ncbi:glycosyltransferase family 69 protein [Chaetomium strumarium]|uniref:Glycosyltransferase family 69 protein n=1 Tax=Chaetomium strumarium TaxID=1170767 RepID=A0AAJ0GWB7_9PEZI|nr:glycosyltransferase family 69 protein [Chaetomium strumarium]
MKPESVARRPRFFRRLLARSTLQKLALMFLIWTILESGLIHYRIARAELESKAQAVLHKPTRVYIASLHWNNEKILRSAWNQAVLDLVKTLGPDNVFVGIYESGSWDNTKGALLELDQELQKAGAGRKIILKDETHADLIAGPPGEEGWIAVPGGKLEPRRIPYLSRLRNLSLQPLLELAENGTTFDHVLFLGDVMFTVSDIITLLQTNDGHYAAACSLDFSKPPLFYDTFALRDARGHEHASQTWPYFRAHESRQAMLHGQPAPVTSCWNGIVAMPSSTFTGTNGLRFRGIPDSLAALHLEGSECCLIHADNPASRARGVFVNPTVRVGYKREAYDAVHPNNGDRSGGSWLSISEIYFGLWRNRFDRWFTTPWFKERRVKGRIERWKKEEEGRDEKGGFCVVDETQVIVYNGWKHV